MIAYRPYNRARAVEYAARYAFSRNPLFYDITELGGDCTSFISQCLLAGSCVMNYTPDFGWYYRSVNDRAPAFTGVEFFWQYMTEAPEFVAAGGNTGPFGRAATEAELEVGDVIQLGNSRGEYYHTLLVTGFDGGVPLVAAHSIDAFNRPLSEYRYRVARYLHMIAVRVERPVPDCFPLLLAGRALPPELPSETPFENT